MAADYTDMYSSLINPLLPLPAFSEMMDGKVFVLVCN